MKNYRILEKSSHAVDLKEMTSTKSSLHDSAIAHSISTDQNTTIGSTEDSIKRADADDDKILTSMGYQPELKRGLGAFMNYAFG